MKKSLLGILLCVLATVCAAANFENVAVTYTPTGVTLSAGRAGWVADLDRILVYRCKNDTDCDELYSSVPKGRSTVAISEYGKFRVRFEKWIGYSLRRPSASAPMHSVRAEKVIRSNPWLVLYEQDVVNIQSLTDEALKSAIRKYAPVFSFAEGERYFPVSVAALFDRPMEDFDAYLRVSSDFSPSTRASDFMRVNGDRRNRLLMKREIASQLVGSRESFPLYWFAEKVKSNEALVTYFLLYGYDEKISPSGLIDISADHELDRESIVIRFRKVSDQWRPVDITFSAHLDDQSIAFLGCSTEPSESSVCSSPSSLKPALAIWGLGKTTIGWSNVSRRGGRPIIYVSRGTHGMNPAFGWYSVRTYRVPTHWELAGDSVRGTSLAIPSLIEMNLSDPSMSALIFSGSTIQTFKNKSVGGPTDSRIRLLPFVRYPAAAYIEDAPTAMDGCIAGAGACAQYVYHFPARWNVRILPAKFDNDYVNFSVACAINFDGTVVGSMYSQYYSGGAFWKNSTGEYSFNVTSPIAGVPTVTADHCMNSGFGVSDTGYQLRQGLLDSSTWRPDLMQAVPSASRWLLPGLPGEPNAFGRGVDDAGTVVGSTNSTFAFYGNNYNGVPLIWLRGSAPKLLPYEPMQGYDNAATAINSAGTVVGFVNNQGVMWKAPYDSYPTKLSLDGYLLYPLSINANAAVAGVARDLTTRFRLPFIWKDGKAQILSFPADTTGRSLVQAMSINFSGDAVGTIDVDTSTGGIESDRPLLWRSGLPVDIVGLSDFFELGLQFPAGAYSLNDNWFIAGTATLNGVTRAIVWIPD